MPSVKIVFPIATIFGIALAATFATPSLVTQSARQIAGHSPYCIQVAGDEADYKPARALFDLSALMMRATRSGGMFMQHHAILVVGSDTSPRLFHWSYWQQKFIPGVLNERLEGYGPAITCMTGSDSAGGLPWIIPQKTGSDYVRFSAHEAYRIPKEYRARWNGGASRRLYIGAPAPDFLPLKNSLAPGDRDSNWISVRWNPKWLLSLMKTIPRDSTVERGTVSVDEQSDGTNTTLIRCGAPSETVPKSCQHRFLNNGRHFYFRHRPEDLPRWRDMQKRVLDLFVSFEVKSAAAQ